MFSGECAKSELDLFTTYPINSSIESSRYDSYKPKEIIDIKDKVFSITVEPGSDYIDLNDIYLHLEIEFGTFKKTNTTDANKTFQQWTNDLKIGPVNNFGHSIFKSIQLTVTSPNKLPTLVERGTDDYHYKAYLLNLLNFGSDAKNGWLNNCLFEQDTPGQFDNFDLYENTSVNNRRQSIAIKQTDQSYTLQEKQHNHGFLRRRETIVEGNGKIKLIFPLYIDMLQTNKLLPAFFGLKFNFSLNPHDLCLLGKQQEAEFKIQSATLNVRKCKINQNIITAHNRALEMGPILYPQKTFRLITRPIDSNTSRYSCSISNIVPNKIILGLVKETSYTATKEQNPFDFQHNDLSKVEINYQGLSFEININRFDNDYVEGYHSLLDTMNMYYSNNSSITPEEYKNGCFLFGYNLNPDKGCDGQFNPNILENCTLNLVFKDMPKRKLRLIILCEYDNQLKISKNQDNYQILYEQSIDNN